jgi:hypothetical protein
MPLYGASEGIDAQRAANRAEIVGGLQAQRLMGEIAMQPADMQYKASLARQHTAQADQMEAQTAAALRLQNIEAQFQEQEAGARQQLADTGRSQGQIVTVADLPRGGSVVRASGADSLEKFVAFAQGKLPPSALADYRKQIADIHQKEAAQAASGARATLDETKTQIERFTQVGNTAGAAALSYQNYAAIMMDPQQRAMLPPELTGDFRADAPVLRAIEQASQDSVKRAKLAQDVADSESRRRLQGAQTASATARTDLIKARQQALKDDRTLRSKYGGSTSQEAADLKKAQVALTKARMEALTQRTAPPMPIDPALVEVGKTYTGAGGVKYDIVGLDAKGMPIGRVHVQGAYTAPTDAQLDPSVLAGDALEGDDNVDD